jgi:hypothetical protein
MGKKAIFLCIEYRKKRIFSPVPDPTFTLTGNSRKWKEPHIIFAQRVQRKLLEIQARLFAWMDKLLHYALVSFNTHVDQILPNFDPLPSSLSGKTLTFYILSALLSCDPY